MLSLVGGFRLGKLVSILSNENKLCRTLYDVSANALDTRIIIGSYCVHIVAQLL